MYQHEANPSSLVYPFRIQAFVLVPLAAALILSTDNFVMSRVKKVACSQSVPLYFKLLIIYIVKAIRVCTPFSDLIMSSVS